MKAYLFLMLTATLLCSHLALISCVKEEVISAIQAFTQCSEIHQISEEVIIRIRNHAHIPDDQELKCWLRCVFKKLGMIKNGKIDWASSIHFTKLCLIGEQDQTKNDQVIKICQAQATAQTPVKESQLTPQERSYERWLPGQGRKIKQETVPQDEEDECELAYSAAVCKIKTWNELGVPQGVLDK